MKRLISTILAMALCLSLCACGRQETPVYTNSFQSGESEHSPDQCERRGHYVDQGQIIVEPYNGMEGWREEVCSVCGYTQQVTFRNDYLFLGSTFILTIWEFAQRLSHIAELISPEMTVATVEDAWCVTTQLQYNGAVFCELTYYDHDEYLVSPYIDNPMGADKLDVAQIRHVNLLDYVDVPHAPGSFAAIAMTFDPQIRLEEAEELEKFLRDTRREHYGNQLVTAINGVGYGHGFIVNQMANSGSISIHAGSEAPDLCAHTPEYSFSGDGIPSGYCTKCGAYVHPAGENWCYLTDMQVLSHSNNSSRSADIVVDNWENPVGAVYWNALRFWVAKKPGLTNSEYIEYALDGSYNTLSGTVLSAMESDPSAVMRVEIYLDGELAFASGDVGYYDEENYVVDISGGETLKMVCITDSSVHGYCVVSAALY